MVFLPFLFGGGGVSLLKPNLRKKGTLNTKGLLGNLVLWRALGSTRFVGLLRSVGFRV